MERASRSRAGVPVPGVAGGEKAGERGVGGGWGGGRDWVLRDEVWKEEVSSRVSLAGVLSEEEAAEEEELRLSSETVRRGVCARGE